MTFKDNVKALRTTADIGQKQLADALNTSPKTISHWETGYSEPSVEQLIRLADYFDISLDELTGRKF